MLSADKYNTSAGPMKRDFQPYADNGGTTVAVAGNDFSLIASDTRLSSGFSIYTRDQSKLFKLTNTSILGSTGCWCDILTFVKVITARLTMYEQDHNKVISTPAAAQLISNMLYYKRFFPYYISNILIGLDNDGKGVIYSYDPVGHCERNVYRAGGSSAALIQPLLDNQIGIKNQENVLKKDLSIDQAKKIVKDVFISAAERDIYCGDAIVMKVVTKDGITEERFDLRRD